MFSKPHPTEYELQNADNPFLADSDHISKHPHRDNTLSSWLWDWWLWDLLGIATSIAATAAMIIVLAVYDSRSLPDWPLGITINAFISFFSTIAKAAMLLPVAESIGQLKWLWFDQPRSLRDFQTFDDASRGPWGSVQLMVRSRSVRLVAVGAIITIVAVAIDPFVQQVVSYPLQSVEIGNATVGRAQIYNADIDIDESDGGLQVGPEFAMKAAIYNGIFTPSNESSVIPNCLTGNCTFPLFDSLAFCSQCSNVTNEVKFAHSKDDPVVTTFHYSLPGSAEVSFEAEYEAGDLVDGPAMITTTDIPENASSAVLGIQNPIISFAMLQFPDVWMEENQGSFFNQMPQAAECALYFCVNTYNVSVTNGVTTSEILSTWHNETGNPTTGSAGIGIGASDGILQPPKSDLSLDISENSTFWIPSGTIAAMKEYLNVTFTGFVNVSGGEVDASDGPVFVNDVMQALNLTQNITALMEGLATSMTSYLRNVGGNNETTAIGTTSKMETYVHVRWAWLGLPIGLLILSTIFLIITMITSKRRGFAIWKTSSLAMLFHGLDGIQEHHAVESRGQMDDIAVHTRVKLRRGEIGDLRLVAGP